MIWARLLRSDLATARIAAIIIMPLSLSLDIVIKHLVTIGDWNGVVLLPGLLDLSYAWNRGISFSLFWQNSARGSALLTIALLAVAIGFAVSALKTDKPLIAAGSSLIVGGALGNLVDRALTGAVFDFLVVRLGSQPLFVCNSADIFITLGAILLIVDMLFAKDERPT